MGLFGMLGACAGRTPDKNIESSPNALTGSFVISGLVSASRGPLVGATVTLQGSENRTAFSDSTGHYSIPGLGAGSYQVSATGGTNCSATAVAVNNLNASVTINLGLTGTGCASFTTVLGPTGPTGPTGPAGPAGPAGPTGHTGATGATGSVGAIGATGAIGPQGPVGVADPAGPQSPIGAASPAGPQGSVGPAGPQGPAGPKGDKGDTGPQGPAGGSTPPLTVIGNMSLGSYVSNAAIRSFSQSFVVPTDPESGAGSGTPQVSDIQISRDADIASPNVALAATTGGRIPTAQVVLAGGALTVNLESVLLLQNGTNLVQDGVPIEQLTLRFRKITWTYNSGETSSTLSYDTATQEYSGGANMTPDYVAFGNNVPANSRPGQIPFSKFSFGTTIPCADVGGGCSGSAQLVSPSITSSVGAQTLAELTALVRGNLVAVVTAHFAALASDGSVVDRMRYQMAQVRVLSVGIDVGVATGVDTSPTRTLQDTMGFDLGKITWPAQSLVGGDDVTQTWDSREKG